MRSSYHTKQKERLIELIKNKNKEFTIKELLDELPDIGLTTIYRFIDKLIEDGKIIKTIGNNNISYYQYLGECIKENHFFLKCDSCGKMIHIDCDCIGDLSSHIIKKHNFKPNKEKIIINGLCDKCIKKGK